MAELKFTQFLSYDGWAILSNKCQIKTQQLSKIKPYRGYLVKQMYLHQHPSL